VQERADGARLLSAADVAVAFAHARSSKIAALPLRAPPT
jgi:hypothetical protein